jgi:hypothetical protein
MDRFLGELFDVACIQSRGLKETPGLYCITPNQENRLFKIGIARDLSHRLDSYCTTYPAGFRVHWVWKGVPKRELTKYESAVFSVMGIAPDLSYSILRPSCGKRTRETEWVQFSRNLSFKQIDDAFRGALTALHETEGFRKGEIYHCVKMQ